MAKNTHIWLKNGPLGKNKVHLVVLCDLMALYSLLFTVKILFSARLEKKIYAKV